ncbi:MAG: hypothetical protein J5594_01065 [Elusimicrobiaceae bacterium]|nr:hypothetical protein [Elusimicrobiaceae bacterium]
MKKILFATLLGVLLVTGCTSTPKANVEDAKADVKQVATQEPSTASKEVNKDCKINGHDCWAVVQKLGKTKEIRTENPDKDNIWVPDIITYENNDLKKWGIAVSSYVMFRDGGSTAYVLNDNIAIRTNRSIGMQGTPAYGQTTIKFKETGKQFIYDSTGELVGNKYPFPN